MKEIELNKIFFHELPGFCHQTNITVNVLRLDLLHEVISGNKWFKLNYYLKDAKQQQLKHIITQGGAYSNHIVATACACKLEGLQAIGIIRGEKAPQLSHTLQLASEMGMELVYETRENFKNKAYLKEKYHQADAYWINEGGYGTLGALGASEIMNWISPSVSHIVCAVGTGTMMAGLLKKAYPNQKIIGINALKGNTAVLNNILELAEINSSSLNYDLMNDFHFGGYAKTNKSLFDWMNDLYDTYSLPTDFVYTGKMLFGLHQLIQNNYFPENSHIVAIHSGGLQGNFSLKPGVLHF